MEVTAVMRNAAVARALAWVDAHATQVAEEAVRICEIPAPTFEEGERAAYVQGRFGELGLRDVTIDAAGNVRGRRPGSGGGPGVAMAAHLDTVFPKGTDVRVRREGDRLHAPGIGDNSVAIAASWRWWRPSMPAGARPAEISTSPPTPVRRGWGTSRG